MYTKTSVAYYDKIYASQGKDYAKEVDYLLQTLRSHGVPAGGSLLDVACGTGSHLVHLQRAFKVEGVELSLDFARIARSKLPQTKIHVADMRSFVTGREYDAITCLFRKTWNPTAFGGGDVLMALP